MVTSDGSQELKMARDDHRCPGMTTDGKKWPRIAFKSPPSISITISILSCWQIMSVSLLLSITKITKTAPLDKYLQRHCSAQQPESPKPLLLTNTFSVIAPLNNQNHQNCSSKQITSAALFHSTTRITKTGPLNKSRQRHYFTQQPQSPRQVLLTNHVSGITSLNDQYLLICDVALTCSVADWLDSLDYLSLSIIFNSKVNYLSNWTSAIWGCTYLWKNNGYNHPLRSKSAHTFPLFQVHYAKESKPLVIRLNPLFYTLVSWASPFPLNLRIWKTAACVGFLRGKNRL